MRHILAAFLAAIVTFLWGFMAWAAVGIWDFSMPKPTNEVALVDAMKSSLAGDGAYAVPAMPAGYGRETSDEAVKKQCSDYEARVRSGPVALILYHRSGFDPMPTGELVRGFGIEFFSALLLACVLSVVKGGFVRKVFVGFTVAMFAATATYGVTGNFMHFPFAFALACWADTIISWTLATVVIAKVAPARQ